jgi:hypothetical protein
MGMLVVMSVLAAFGKLLELVFSVRYNHFTDSVYIGF